ncbi:MAG: hypothetical protein ACOY4W_07240 [Thermodesulfobacteriota bacterium]
MKLTGSWQVNNLLSAGNKQMVKRTRWRDSKQYRTAAGCFALLAIGTLPTLFSNPLEYLMGLGYCLLFSVGIALLLC